MQFKNTQTHFNVLERLSEIREQRNMTVYRLAKLSGIPQSSIATWYSKQFYPPIDKLEILCNVLEISLADFFNTTPTPLHISNQEGELINKYRLLTNTEKKTIDIVIDTIHSAHKK